MVARVTLNHLVEVQILAGQLLEFALTRKGSQTPEKQGFLRWLSERLALRSLLTVATSPMINNANVMALALL